MSCPNYKTMDNFSLFVFEEGDSIECQIIADMVCEELDEMNRSLLFHKIRLDGGYYYGMQFVVEEENNPNDLDNDDCRYYFDLYRSVAIRRYDSEINKINRWLRKLADSYDFTEMVCTAVFSNGEAIYAPASNPRARLKAAVCCG